MYLNSLHILALVPVTLIIIGVMNFNVASCDVGESQFVIHRLKFPGLC